MTTDLELARSQSEGRESLPWIEKYRPSDIDQVISHKDIIHTLKCFIKKKSFPHVLFFGPPGTGKTSTIRCCINEIYGQYSRYMTLVLNASNERGIETIRGTVKTFITSQTGIFLPPELRNIHKIVVLDEIDSMTVEAQGMLRQIIEKMSATTRFCLICNDIDKINIALQSRCSMFRFPPLSVEEMSNRLAEICESEDIRRDNKMVLAVVKVSSGDMRSAVNILQQAKMAYGTSIKEQNIYRITSHSSPQVNETIFKALSKLYRKNSLLRSTIDMIDEIVISENITMLNLMEELKNLIIGSTFETHQKIFLIDHLATYENADSVSVNVRVIVTGICGLFVAIPK